jgi:hypothetical protein
MRQANRYLLAGVAMLLLSAVGVSAQDVLSGKYEGIARMAGAADTPITLELKNEGGKISGRLLNGQTSLEISEGALTEGNLSLKFGPEAKDGSLVVKVEGESLTGDWVSGSDKKTVSLKKAATATSAEPLNLSGQWDALADVEGQSYPFVLTLKIDGEKVSGSSSSQLGDANITSGSWKEGTLSFQLEGQSGVITMSAVVLDGKLSGQFDFAGQMQGKWVAVRKN